MRARQLFGLDLRSLAVLRMSLGGLQLVDLGIRARSLAAHYGDAGVLPRDVLVEHVSRPWHWSVYLTTGETWTVALLFVVHAVAAVALLVGRHTRLACVVCWVFVVSLQNRNPLVLNAGDTLLRMLLFWSLFLPLGARWSLDARRAAPRVVHPTFLSPATVALTLQVCMVYWLTTLHRTKPAWWSGEALYYALNADLFATHAGVWLREIAWVLPPLTWATLYWEMLGPLLLFVPWHTALFRTIAVAGFCLLHAGIATFMDVGLFSPVCIAAWLALLPTAFWDRLERMLGRPVAVAAPPLQPGWAGLLLAPLFLVYVTAWNLRTLDFAHFSRFMPVDANVVGRLFRTEQRWRLFAPGPSTNDGWFLVEATLADGARVDLLGGGGPIDRTKPALVLDTIPDRRWGKYLSHLRRRKYRRQRVYFLRYLARRWNAAHDAAHRVTRLELVYMREDTKPDHIAEPRPIVLWRLTTG